MEARLEARSRRSVHGRAGGVSTERSVTQRTLEKRGEDRLGNTVGIRSYCVYNGEEQAKDP